MKTFLRSSMSLLVGATLTLTSCQYPYYYQTGPNQRAGTVYGAAGGALLGGIIGNQSRSPLQGAFIGGVLGGLAGNALGSNRDRYYTVRSSPVYSSRYYSGRSAYSSRPYYSSYYGRPQPYYIGDSYSRPYYSSSYCSPYGQSSYGFNNYNYRPWGGGFGFGQPFGMGQPYGFGNGLGYSSLFY